MAIRRFEVPGKITVGTPAQVFLGPTGQYGWGVSVSVPPQQFFVQDPDYLANQQSVKGIFSCWFNYSSTSSDPNAMLNFEDSTGVHDFQQIGVSSGAPRILLRDSSKNTLIDVTATTASTNGAWNHVVISWDLTAGNTYADDFHLYLNGVNRKPVSPSAYNVGTAVEWGTGNLFVTSYRVGVIDITGLVAVVKHAAWYLAIDQYLDLSIASNLRKFIDADGNPVALGMDGSRPTGTAPDFYFDNPVATLLTNRGTGGNATTNATLADATGPNP
jgi:hypothetical protein